MSGNKIKLKAFHRLLSSVAKVFNKTLMMMMNHITLINHKNFLGLTKQKIIESMIKMALDELKVWLFNA